MVGCEGRRIGDVNKAPIVIRLLQDRGKFVRF
jgi:hypothetical protein